MSAELEDVRLDSETDCDADLGVSLVLQVVGGCALREEWTQGL